MRAGVVSREAGRVALQLEVAAEQFAAELRTDVRVVVAPQQALEAAGPVSAGVAVAGVVGGEERIADQEVALHGVEGPAGANGAAVVEESRMASDAYLAEFEAEGSAARLSLVVLEKAIGDDHGEGMRG